MDMFCRWGWRRVDAVLVFCRGITLTAALPGGFWEPCYSQTLYMWQQLVSAFSYSDVPSVWACGRHDLSCHHCHSHLQKNHVEMKTSFPSCGSPSIKTVIGRAHYFKLEDKILKIPFYLITKTSSFNFSFCFKNLAFLFQNLTGFRFCWPASPEDFEEKQKLNVSTLECLAKALNKNPLHSLLKLLWLQFCKKVKVVAALWRYEHLVV